MLESKIGTAKKRFGELLLKLLEKYELIISSNMKWKKANTYRVQKESSTDEATGTNYPSSLISILLYR